MTPSWESRGLVTMCLKLNVNCSFHSNIAAVKYFKSSPDMFSFYFDMAECCKKL